MIGPWNKDRHYLDFQKGTAPDIILFKTQTSECLSSENPDVITCLDIKIPLCAVIWRDKMHVKCHYKNSVTLRCNALVK